MESVRSTNRSKDRSTNNTSKIAYSALCKAGFTAGFTAVLFASTAAVAGSADKVLVIDEGVDLFHQNLKQNNFVNAKELNGREGIDDDNNGFVDDVSGWNLLSDDSAYFPDSVRDVFEGNRRTVSTLLRYYDRIEEGDQEAIEYVYGDAEIAESMSWVLSKSHGTHVAGIIQKYGNPEAVISSANVFTPNPRSGAEGNSPSNFIIATSRPILSTNEARFLAGLWRLEEKSLQKMRLQIQRLHSQTSASPSEATDTIFDDTQGVTDYVENSRLSDKAQKLNMSNYLRSTGSRVVNLSLGFAKQSWKTQLDSIWQRALKEQRLPKTTPMTTTQKANYDKLLSTFDNAQDNWDLLFRGNPRVLFVVAAGNDGQLRGLDGRTLPNAGDNAIYEVVPANNAKDNRNVITVAATTMEGVIADFSNYNPTLVNIGAPGVAISSLAPDDNFVKMSGTSMASPWVAGVASAMFSENPRLSPSNVKYLLERTSDYKASLKDKVKSRGMVNKEAALQAARRAFFFGSPNSPLSQSDLERAAGMTAQDGFFVDAMGLELGAGFGNLIRTVDTTVAGQIHKTNKAVQKFLR